MTWLTRCECHGTTHKHDNQVTTATVLTSTERVRQLPTTKKIEEQDEIVKERERNGHPKTASDALSTKVPPNSSPQYIKKVKTGYRVFPHPKHLLIPIFLPNVSIFPYLLLISSLWSLILPNFRQVHIHSCQR